MTLVRYINLFLSILGIVFCFACASATAYEVEFKGVSDPKILKLINDSSQLQKLKTTPPATLIGLRRRAEGDVPNIVQALHSLAYYNAKVEVDLQNNHNIVIVNINTGPVYPLAKFQIRYTQNDAPFHELENRLCLADLKISLGAPALPETILNGEDNLLDQLNLLGYAFASIKKRDVLVDQQAHHVIVILDVETGPLSYFGPITISGNKRVEDAFFYKKLQWREGDLYDPRKVEKTQEALELSGLFRSVNLTHAEKPTDGNLIPFNITVVESKQRSVGFGLSYSTELGPGILGEWEDRNIAGKGEKLSFRADIWQVRQEGRLAYLIPDFCSPHQNLLWVLDYHHDKLEAFTDSTFSLSGTIERKVNERLRVSYGGMYKFIRAQHSNHNGTFDLIQAPLQLRWSNTDSLLDPTKGGTITFKVVPSLQFLNPQFAYCINTFTGSVYYSLTEKSRHILAAKLMLGSIFGASKHDIPPPERFYAGSENALRGYKYLTVSPLDHDHKPIGGRSLFIYSLELRSKVTENIGWVAFYEIGNVFANPYPDLKKGLLQSAGLGLRYYTPVGPLRLDVAVPLNRRHHIDGPFQIYFSIGQSF